MIVLLTVLYEVETSPYTKTTTTNFRSFSANNRSFQITYFATNLSTWQSGLMNKTVTNSTFMLFVFPELGYYPFWMYDTYTNLDIMWLSVNGSKGTVVSLVRNVTGCFNSSACTIYNSTYPANYVLEARAGFAELNNITAGTVITFH